MFEDKRLFACGQIQFETIVNACASLLRFSRRIMIDGIGWSLVQFDGPFLAIICRWVLIQLSER